MSQLLRPMDFNDVSTKLNQFYPKEEGNAAIDSLLQFYKDEAFDNEDITNDWIPGDFKNCDGIDRLMESFHCTPPLNCTPPNAKQILFNWFCHWLLPNTPQPNQPPHTPHTDNGTLGQLDPIIVAIATTFELRLPVDIALFKQQPQLANNVRNTFEAFCEEEAYTLEDLENDLDELDDSSIMDEIIDKHEQCDVVKQEIFNLLCDIVVEKKEGDEPYPPFNISAFKWKASEENWNRTNRLCTKEIPSLFRNDVKEQNPDNLKETDDDGMSDWALMSAKALDFENRFPFLINMMDAFARYCAEENCKLWCKCAYDDINIGNLTLAFTPKSKAEDTAKHPSVLWTPTDWLMKQGACRFYNYIKERNKDAAEYVAGALKSMLKRSWDKFNLNHIMEATVYDDYSVFCLYMCAANKHVYGMLDVKGKGRSRNEHLPMQIDFWIIPRLTKKNVHTDWQLPDDLNDCKWGAEADDMEDNECGPDIQSLGKSDKGSIWNVEDNLKGAGYEEGVDYWCYTVDEDTIGDYRVDTLMKHMRALWGKNTEAKGAEWQNTRYARYVMIIDRRNPDHLAKREMKDDTNTPQDWSDRMYLIRPKLKKDKGIKKSNHYDRIAEQYAVVLNETFIENTNDYLLPMPHVENGVYSNDFSALDAGNGYKFVVSFHLHFSNKVKMYWCYGKGAMRFFMKDVCWLWPRYFKFDSKNDSFQVLNHDAKIALDEAIKKYPLNDLQFDEFVNQINAL